MADKSHTEITESTEMGAIIDGGDSTEMYHLGSHRGMRPNYTPYIIY